MKKLIILLCALMLMTILVFLLPITIPQASGQTGTVGTTVVELPYEIKIISPSETTYSFNLEEEYIISLETSLNFDIENWWYKLEDPNTNTILSDKVTFNPEGSQLRAIPGVNKLTIYAQDSLGRIATQSITFQVTIPESRQVVSTSLSCTPQIVCGEWSQCSYTGKTEDVINGRIDFTGIRERSCKDVNNCIEGFVEETTCKESFQLEFTKITECDEEYLLARNPITKSIIAKINLDSWDERNLDIIFTQSQTRYCSSCYNGLEDNNEEGLDCGGDCKPCQ